MCLWCDNKHLKKTTTMKINISQCILYFKYLKKKYYEQFVYYTLKQLC